MTDTGKPIMMPVGEGVMGRDESVVVFNTGAALAQLGACYASVIIDRGLDFDVLFGPAYKGIPLVSAIAVALSNEHGIDKLLAKSGKLVGEELRLSLDLPAERRATNLEVRVATSLAVTMLDALPYLIEYPYGCTEQTMSRFLPAVITARTLTKLGRGETPGPESSINKIVSARKMQDISLYALD